MRTSAIYVVTEEFVPKRRCHCNHAADIWSALRQKLFALNSLLHSLTNDVNQSYSEQDEAGQTEQNRFQIALERQYAIPVHGHL
jgi:hypothetical protein